MKSFAKSMAATMTALILGTVSAYANQVTVQELAFDPGVQIANISVTGFYTGGVYAGINHLLVSGTVMNGFCIDPFHFSSTSPLLYNVVPLSSAPKPPGTMDANQTAEIGKLWGEYYSPTMSPLLAAGMQIAIWEIVAGNRFAVSGGDFGAAGMIQNLSAYTGASADLVALSGPGQDYVVQRTAALQVPDQGSTLLLLGISLAGLLAVGATRERAVRTPLGC